MAARRLKSEGRRLKSEGRLLKFMRSFATLFNARPYWALQPRVVNVEICRQSFCRQVQTACWHQRGKGTHCDLCRSCSLMTNIFRTVLWFLSVIAQAQAYSFLSCADYDAAQNVCCGTHAAQLFTSRKLTLNVERVNCLRRLSWSSNLKCQ